MNSWSFRRKLIYVSVAVIVLLIVVLIPTIFVLNKAPTCSDGTQNGDETGTDCGGACQRLCSFEAVKPTVLWSRAFKITDGVYSAVAYVENQNINSETVAPYIFKIFDSSNALIAERKGTTYIQKNKILAVFEPNINTGQKIPARVSFEFDEDLEWSRNTTKQPELEITQRSLTNETVRPRIDAGIKNKSLETVENIELVAVVYDNKQNAIAASRTLVDRLAKDEVSNVTFTWPQPFASQEEICRVPNTGSVGSRPQALGVMLAIDRSGSMSSQGSNPPQPLTAVKNAAISFVNKFKGTDQVGVVSFANTASDPVDAPLSQNYSSVVSSIQNISISGAGTQYTNIGDGLDKSQAQLFGPNAGQLTNRVIVLLTDGDPNKPEKSGDRNYPQTFALQEAEEIKKAGVEIFTIGLGSEVNPSFLKSLATVPEYFYTATSSGDLAGIYDKIAIKFCSTEASVVEIIPRILPN